MLAPDMFFLSRNPQVIPTIEVTGPNPDMKPKTERRARFDSMMNTLKRQEVSI